MDCFEQALRDEYTDQFIKVHHYAVSEYERLEALFGDVAWYNFEVAAHKWRDPWPSSWTEGTLTLKGKRFDLVQGRGGRQVEKRSFPIYFQGTVCDAPPLPPQILLSELELARQLVAETSIACAAPDEWAPGGRLYQQMLETSPGVAAFSSNA